MNRTIASALAFTLVAGPSVTMAGGAAVQVTTHSEGHCERPLWSRDGTRLAYERRVGEVTELYILDTPLKKSKPRRVLPPTMKPVPTSAGSSDSPWEAFEPSSATPPGTVCRDFTWGPKRRRSWFAYTCNTADGIQLYMSARGIELTKDGIAGQPAFNPQSDSLVFVQSNGSDQGNVNIVTWGSRGPMPPAPMIAPRPGLLRLAPTWESTGQSVVFEQHPTGGESDLYRAAAPGRAGTPSVPMQLTKSKGYELSPSISPDGRMVAYFSHKSAKMKRRKDGSSVSFDLFVRDLASSVSQKVASDAATHRGGVTWTPDGRFIVYARNDVRANNPLVAVSADAEAWSFVLPTGTVSNEDPNVVANGEDWFVAFSAIGTKRGTDRSYRKVYVWDLRPLKEGELTPEKNNRSTVKLKR